MKKIISFILLFFIFIFGSAYLLVEGGKNNSIDVIKEVQPYKNILTKAISNTETQNTKEKTFKQAAFIALKIFLLVIITLIIIGIISPELLEKLKNNGGSKHD